MAAISVQVPYPVFYDRDGQPLDNGNIYIGDANQDPVTNPIQVYYDEALTITASQPLKTSGGYVYRNGTPAQLYVNANDFSILVNDSKNTLVYSLPEATGIVVGAGSVSYDPTVTYSAGSLGAFLDPFFGATDAKFEVTTEAGAGLQRGIAIEHYADTTGSYGLDIHQYQGAKNALVVHCYSDENGAVAGAVAAQIDHTRSGNILVLKNAENAVTSPGTKGTANFITGVGYGGAGQTTPGTLFSWTHQNVILVPDDYWPLKVSGNGMEVICGTTASRCFKATSLSDTKYGVEAYGTKFGAYVSTTLDSGFTAGFVKNGTGAGTVIAVINKGTGDFQIGLNAASAERYKIDSAGQYYIQGNRILTTQQPFIADPTGGATVDAEARTSINAILDLLAAHGLMAPV